MSLIKHCFVIFILLVGSSAFPQNNTPLLDKKVSVSFDNTPLKVALFEISVKADFNISYNSEILPLNNKVTFSCRDFRVQDILPKIIPADIYFSTSGNSLVLLKKSVKAIEKKDIVIKGVVKEFENDDPINASTVLDVYGLNSVLTDSLGNFELKLSYKQHDLFISVNKLGFIDTTLVLKPESQSVSVRLQKFEPDETPQLVKIEELPINPVEMFPISRLIIPSQMVINAENIRGYSKRKFQFSFTPGLSSNLKIAGTVKNDISINLIGGYNYGVGWVEIGGLFNINRSNVGAVQFAGFSNLVGGNFNGLQMAGAFNRTKGKQNGVQISVLSNYNSGNFSGLQMNIFLNKANHLQGLQLSSLVNICDTLNGAQIGFVNRTRQQNGFQLGLININNSSSGLSLGVLNFAKDKKFPRLFFDYRKKK